LIDFRNSKSPRVTPNAAFSESSKVNVKLLNRLRHEQKLPPTASNLRPKAGFRNILQLFFLISKEAEGAVTLVSPKWEFLTFSYDQSDDCADHRIGKPR